MADDATTGAVKTKNPSPLVYDKEKNKECKFEEVTTSDEKSKDKDCRKTVIYVDKEGYIQNANIIKDTVEILDIGQEINVLNAIVLHRTDGYSARGTITKYKTNNNQIGSHFVIDKNGDIYQTLGLSRVVQHVGPIRPRCVTEQTVTPEELKK
ncbi:TPA: N-acetylmuramoyl-L-alanine amidase [Salmonella enterica]|nr:N-acetylmuramoyl-L-alanine amidase [Salmonella enterica]